MKKYVMNGVLACVANEREVVRDSMVISCGVCKREIKLKKVFEGKQGKDKRIVYKRTDGAKIGGKTWNISYNGFSGTVYESHYICGNCARYKAFNGDLTFGQAVENSLECAEEYRRRQEKKVAAKVKEEEESKETTNCGKRTQEEIIAANMKSRNSRLKNNIFWFIRKFRRGTR